MDEIIDSGHITARAPKKKQLVEGTIQGYPIGRDKKIVPPDEVQKLAALGCTNRDIANFFGIAEDNIVRHFADFITKGREELKISLRRAMLNNACKNNNAAVQIFLAKNILGMSDTPVNTEDQQPLPWSDN
jgi:hypothetical protein